MAGQSSLNHIYRTVWNEALGAMVAVAEIASGRGKSSGNAVRGHISLQAPLEAFAQLGVLAVGVALAWGAVVPMAWGAAAQPPAVQAALSNPTGGVVVSGSASFVAKGNYLTVNTGGPVGTTANTAINWQSFSIPAGSTTYFNQPTAASTVLNRVVTNTPSLIFGTLGSNGNVVLVNQSGITIGNTAVVDTAGFTAAALQRNDNSIGYGAQVYGYGGVAVGNLQVQGGAKILARGTGGDVVLLGGNVNVDANALIQAPSGNVILAAGETVTMVSRGLDNISFTLGASSSAAVNLGTLEGNAVGIFADTLNHSGSILANGVASVTDDGRVYLKSNSPSTGTATVNGTITAKKTSSGYGGEVLTSAAAVQVGTATSVNTLNGSNAGTWTINAPNFTVAADTGSLPSSGMEAATLTSALVNNNVSIAAGYGGTVTTTGDVTWANRALGLTGANVHVQSVLAGTNAGLSLGGNTDFGTAPDGTFAGRANLSTNSNLVIGGTAYTIVNSPSAVGLSGNYALGSNANGVSSSIGTSGSPFTGTFTGLGHTVSGVNIQASGATDVGLFGYVGSSGVIRDLRLDGASVTGGSNVGALVGTNAGTLRNVSVTGSSVVKASGGAPGDNFGGLVGVNAGGQITTAFSAAAVSGANTAGGLVGLNNGSITNAKATGDVSGADGAGGLVGYNNNTIDSSTASGKVRATNSAGGLAGENMGSITNSTASGSEVRADRDVGGLVGLNTNSISASHSTVGLVGGDGSVQTNVGGLVGNNSGTIDGSDASSNVTGYTGIGGLVGLNDSGAVTGSHATGAVNADSDYAGGLIGVNLASTSASTVANSYATGIVNGGNYVGGLIGYNSANGYGGNISSSHATGNVSGVNKVGGLVGAYVLTRLTSLVLMSDSHAEGSVTGNSDVGGLIGATSKTNGYGGVVSGSDATGSVNGVVNVGGLVGNNGAGWTITGSSASGTEVRASGGGSLATGVGGLVGLNAGVVTSSHSYVGLVRSDGDNQDAVGGLVGKNTGSIGSSSASTVVSGNASVGGLVGHNAGGVIANSYADGSNVSGATAVGGLVGWNVGSVDSSYADTEVSSNNYAGGLVGLNAATVGIVSNSYAIGQTVLGAIAGGLVGGNDGSIATSYSDVGTVSGSGAGYVGGLVGGNNAGATITDAYSLSDVKGNGASSGVGGLAGNNGGTISRTYATGNVSSSGASYGGLVGYNYGSAVVDHSYWDVETTHQATGYGSGSGTAGWDNLSNGPLASSDALSASNYDFGWVLNQTPINNWYFFDGDTRPFLKMENTSVITNAHQLQMMAYNPSADYTLGNGINLSVSRHVNANQDMWGGSVGQGFAPIANFSGSFDGQSGNGYSIVGLTINRPDQDQVGLFSTTTSSATIQNLVLDAAQVTGRNTVGAVVGENTGSISNVQVINASVVNGSSSGGTMIGGLVGSNLISASISSGYSTAAVNGYQKVGGLVGSNAGRIANSTVDSDAAITGLGGSSSAIGGLVGYASNSSVISAGHTYGQVSGVSSVGGLVGENHYGSITNSYSTSQVNGSTSVGGLVGYNDAGYIGSSHHTVGTVIGDISSTAVGGLVGENASGEGIGSVTNSYSSGLVSGGSVVGGLVGLNNYASVSDSHSSSDVRGGDAVGGLVGRNSGGDISNVYTNGTVIGQTVVGGLVGLNESAGTILQARSLGSLVQGDDKVGGLVGSNSADIAESYSTVQTVRGLNSDAIAGGLVGYNSGTLSVSYADGGIVTAGGYVGGLVGTNGLGGTIANTYSLTPVDGGSTAAAGGLVGQNNGSISTSYSTGSVAGTGTVGGLVGLNGGYGAIVNSYWDMQSSHQAQPTGIGQDLNTTAQSATGFAGSGSAMNALADYSDFVTTDAWFMVDGNTRPFLQMEWSQNISNAHQLQLIAMNLSASYTLLNDIDLGTELSKNGGMWASNGFVPLGKNTNAFGRTFDGATHTISNLNISRPAEDYVGLFGYVAAGAIVRSVHLTGASVVGHNDVGLVAGHVDGIYGEGATPGVISAVTASGSVLGSGGSNVGGLVGYNYGSVIDSSFTGALVSGSSYVGGLVGYNDLHAHVTNSTVSGPLVSGNSNVGGLVGSNYGTVSLSSVSGSRVSASSYAGGLVGSNYGTVISSTVSASQMSAGFTVGGLVGYNYGSGSILNSSVGGTSFVSGSSTVGGLVGFNDGGGMSNSHYDIDTVSGPGGSTMVTFGALYHSQFNAWITGPSLNISNYTTGGTPSFTSCGTNCYVINGTQGMKDLLGFADSNHAYTFQLGGDINLAGLTNYNIPYLNSNLDGQRFSISGLNINQPYAGNVGLVGALDGAYISNIWSITGSVNGQFNVGGLVGHNSGGSISSVNATVDVTAGIAVLGSNVSNVGGLVGVNYNGMVTYSSASGSVHGQGGQVGGLIGLNYGRSISAGSVASSSATGLVSGAYMVGGLIGLNDGGLVQTSFSSGAVSGADSVGGLVGDNSGTVSYSYSTSAVHASDSIAGGLVGQNETSAQVITSFAGGDVFADSAVGGLVGWNNGGISNSYAQGAVTASTNTAGGLAGRSDTGNISETYATGAVSAPVNAANVGGLVGYIDLAGTTVSKSFFDTTNSGQTVGYGNLGASADAAGRTSAELKMASTYAAWTDLTAAADLAGAFGWRIYEGHTGPLLSAFLTPVTVSATSLNVTYDGTSYHGLSNASYVVGDPTFSTAQTVSTAPNGVVNVNDAYLGARNVKLASGTPIAYAPDVYSSQFGYDIAFDATNNGSLTINPASVTLTAPVISKTYDGGLAYTTKAADLASLSGALFGGDTVTAATLAYLDKNAGTANKAVSLNGVSLSDGNGGNNYIVSYQNNATSTIIPANLTVSTSNVTKTYNASTDMTGATGQGAVVVGGTLYSGDNLSGGSFAYTDKNAGAGTKSVSVSGVAVTDGVNSGNYNVSYQTNTTSTITPAVVTLTAPVVSKSYDGGLTYTTSAADLAALGTALLGSDTVSSATLAYADKNVGTGNKAVSLSGVTLNDGNGGNNYIVSTAGNTASTITPANLTVSTSNVSKTYNALTDLTGASGQGAVVVGGTLFSGDSLSGGSFAYTDKNAGTGNKTVTVAGVTVTDGVNSGNYNVTYQNNTTSTINPASVSNWIGGSSGLWSSSANWDLQPEAANVLSVVIPAGKAVTFDASAATTTLQSLSGSGASVMVTGGSLAVTGALTTASYTQAGGSLAIDGPLTASSYNQSGGGVTGGGSVVVNGSFVHTAGSIAVAGPVSITQSTGNLAVGSISGGSIALTAAAGSITQSAPLASTGLLSANATGGSITLDNPANAVAAFAASTSGVGNVALTNSHVLDVQGITVANGNLVLDNTGGWSNSGGISVPAGSIQIATHSPLAVNAAIAASGDIALSAMTPDTTSNMSITAPVTSTAGGISIQVYNNLYQNSRLTAALGLDVSAGSISLGANAYGTGNPVTYTVAGQPYTPVWFSQTSAGGVTDSVATFLDAFQLALDEQNGSSDDPLGKKKQSEEGVVVEDAACKP